MRRKPNYFFAIACVVMLGFVGCPSSRQNADVVGDQSTQLVRLQSEVDARNSEIVGLKAEIAALKLAQSSTQTGDGALTAQAVAQAVLTSPEFTAFKTEVGGDQYDPYIAWIQEISGSISTVVLVGMFMFTLTLMNKSKKWRAVLGKNY